MADSELLGTEEARPLIPDETHGFSVQMELGPYPLGAKGTHRKALYCWFRPITPKTIAACQWKNASAIVGCLPLTLEQALDVQADPESPKVEHLHAAAYRAALSQAEQVDAER